MRLWAACDISAPGPYQKGNSGAQSRLGLTLIPRSVGSSEVACWDPRCHMPASGCGQGSASEALERVCLLSFPSFWVLLGVCDLDRLPASV